MTSLMLLLLISLLVKSSYFESNTSLDSMCFGVVIVEVGTPRRKCKKMTLRSILQLKSKGYIIAKVTIDL